MRDIAQTIRIRQEVRSIFQSVSTVRAMQTQPKGGKS